MAPKRTTAICFFAVGIILTSEVVSVTAMTPFDNAVFHLVNSFRYSFRAPPLTWNANLAATAKACANTHASSNSLSPPCKCGTGIAETIGTSFNPAPSQGARSIISAPVTGAGATQTWYGRFIDNCVDFSQPTFNASCFQFTQVVWASTTQFGCGYSDRTAPSLPEDPGAYIMSCCWSPAGNTPATFAQNVREDNV